MKYSEINKALIKYFKMYSKTKLGKNILQQI